MSVSSQIEIANRALTKLGAKRIISFSDNNDSAKAVSSMWNAIRDAELRAHLWRFSIVRTSIARLSTTPTFGYDYEYQIPNDCIKLVQIGECYLATGLIDYINRSAAPFSLESNKILTNEGDPLKIRYVQRVTDTNQYDSCFVEALACRLAAELCETLTQSNTKRQMAWEEYKQAIKTAIIANALETPPEPLFDDSWIVSRL